ATFVTMAFKIFGPHISALTWSFTALLGASVALFLARFGDRRTLVVPALFCGLTLMLMTPAMTTASANQAPFGGFRFFIIAGILPTLHLMLEASDSERLRPATAVLAGLQLLILLVTISVRLGAIYFIVAIVIAAAFRFQRRATMPKLGLIGAVLLVAFLGGQHLAPVAYRDAGLVSDTTWHRAFMGLGINPHWPFGN